MNLNTNAWFENEEQETESISKPTKEEYAKSLEDAKTFASWIRLAKNKQTELIDALAIERENEKMYTKLYEKNKEVVQRYEIYEKLEQAAEENKK